MQAKHSTMSKGKSLFGRIFILSVLCHVCLSFAVANARFVDGHYVINDVSLDFIIIFGLLVIRRKLF